MTFLEAVAPPGTDVDTSSSSGRSAISDDNPAIEVVTACALATAVAAGFTGATPTGTEWWDSALTAALAALFVVAAARSHRYVIIGAAAVAAMFVGLSPWLPIALGGFGAAIAAGLRPTRATELRALAGALCMLGLLHLGEFGIFGLSALVAGLAVATVLVSGYLRSGPTTRLRVRKVALGISLIFGTLLVIAAYVGVSVRTNANAGVEAARLGLDAARSGDTQQLALQLDRAQTQLGTANDQVSSPVLKPLLLVPIAAQHLRSLSSATEQGLQVATEAVAAAQDANLEELQLRQGQFDLDLLAQMAPRLERAVDSLEQTILIIEADRSPWLLPQVDRQLRALVDEAIEVLPEARTAAEATRIMPPMLGADGERRYLMLFGSPGESREFGGFVGGYALISVLDGGLDLIDAGSINELVFLPDKDELDDPRSYPVEYAAVDPFTFPQNLTSTPNLGVIARAVRDVFPQLEGAPVDGVIYADPYALAAMTEFTGPIAVDGIDEPLDQDGLVDFIFDGQYRAFDGREERFGAIGALAEATAASFEGADLPGPERLGEVLGPAARAGRLQIVTYDDRENEFLTAVKLQRHFVAPTEVDAFAVVQTNGSASKLDLFLHRSIRYDVTVDQDGQLVAIVDVELRSDMTAGVPALTLGETDGTNQVLLSLYSPHALSDVTVDGQTHRHVVHNEFGFFRYALFKIPLPPNETATVRFTLRGDAPPGDYRVGVWSQPMVNNDVVEVIYRQRGADAVVATQELTESWLFDPQSPDADS